MLSTSGFYRLSFVQQADLLVQQGTFLHSRPEGKFLIDLYELNDLLIEIFYQKETEEPVSVMAYNAAEKLKTISPKNLQPRLTMKNGAGNYRKDAYAA